MSDFPPPASELSKIGVAAFPTAGQGLALDDSGKIPPNVGTIIVLSKEATAVDVQNSASEASVVNSHIVANSMGAIGALRLTAYGDLLYNNSTADGLRMRLKFGGTTHFDFSETSRAVAAARRMWIWEVFIGNAGAPNSQYLLTRFQIMGTNVGGTTNAGAGGFGNLLLNAAAIATLGGIGGAGALTSIDTSLDQDLTLTVQWSAASVNNSFRKKYSMLELF